MLVDALETTPVARTERERDLKVRQLCAELFEWSPHADDATAVLTAALTTVIGSVLETAPAKHRLNLRAQMFEFTEVLRRQLRVRKARVM